MYKYLLSALEAYAIRDSQKNLFFTLYKFKIKKANMTFQKVFIYKDTDADKL